MNTKNNNTGTGGEDTNVSESRKMKEITEALNILLAEKETREKGEKIKKILWIVVVIMIVYNTFIFFSLYRYFTSYDFLENMKYRAIEAMPSISQELGKTAEKSAPILFEQLKGQFEAYLPVLKNKLLEQHTQLVSEAVTITKGQFNELIKSELDAIIERMKANGGMDLTPEQINLLQKEMADKSSALMDELITKNVGEQLNQCIAGAQSLTTLSDSLDRVTRTLGDKLDTKSDAERKKIGFDIVRSFFDMVDTEVTGRPNEGMENISVPEKQK